MTDLETRLRGSGRDLHLQRPVDEVIARGRAVRRRRRTTVGVVALVVVGATVGAGWATGRLGAPDPGVAARPAPEMIQLSGGRLARAERDCRDGMTGSPAAYGDLRLVAAGATTAGTILIYGSDRYAYRCTLLSDIGGSGTGGGESTSVLPVAGRELVSASYERSVPEGGRQGALVGYGRVDPSVARATVTVEGQQVDVAVGRGWYWFWTRSAGSADTPAPPADLRAYDASGRLLTRVTVPAG